MLLKFVDVAHKYYNTQGLIHKHELPIKLAKGDIAKNELSFPGKIAISKGGDRLAVSDTGNHQVVIMGVDGVVTERIGCGERGCVDGSFDTARFHAPQGLTWHNNDTIYVADTENHVIRCVDLTERCVSTVAGVAGVQGDDKEGGGKGVQQPISSPWDVVVGPSPGSEGTSDNKNNNGDDTCLYIAMAGSHQIWCYYLKDGSWLKKGSQV